MSTCPLRDRSFMPRLLLLALALAICFVSTAVAQEPSGPAPSDDEVAIRQQYKAFDELLVGRDLDGVTALMDKDVKFEAGRRKMDLKGWRRIFDSQVASLISSKTRVEAVVVNGKTADVQTWCEQRYANLKVEGTDKTRFVVRTGSIDRWIRTPQGWRLKSSKQQATDIEPLD